MSDDRATSGGGTSPQSPEPAFDPGKRPLGPAGRIARAFLESKLTPLLVVGSLLLGALAVLVTPREEEPQIRVPMVDVSSGLPGATAVEVERRVIGPLERKLAEIDDAEYIYSTSQPSGGMVIVRFKVGTDPDRAVLRVQAKVAEALPLLPTGAIPPRVEPRGIDDVPVIAYTLWSPRLPADRLRAVALELASELGKHPRVARVSLLGGGRRALNVTLDRTALQARGLSPLAVYQALAGADERLPAGSFDGSDRQTDVEVGSALRSAADVEGTVIGTPAGPRGYVRDVARVEDGPAEPDQYVWVLGGAAAKARGIAPGLDAAAVTLAIAKKPGTNAIDLVRDLDTMVARLRGSVIPADVGLVKTRDYGFTADEKSNELMEHLGIATLAVVLLMAIALGRREAVVVAVAVPTTLALTLAASWLFGYTLNRVTLFALIFAIGILVDDAIVVVENIHRHYQLGWTAPRRATVVATDEVGNPTILATLTVIAALLPLAYVSGLMGPYMRPIPINASAAMLVSLLVAFVVSPWLTFKLFRKHAEELAEAHDDAREPEETVEESRLHRRYARLLRPLLERPVLRWSVLGGVVALLLVAMALVPLGMVTVKMLPYDNKSELQVVVDMPEGTTLATTAGLARRLAESVRDLPEVTDVEVYAGTSAPFNFNGLVRHYFLRSGPLVADLQVNLLPKGERHRSSHQIASLVRERLRPLVAGTPANVKVTEVPPGPPVLSTMVAEIYGPDEGQRIALARQVRTAFEQTPGVVDVDWYVQKPAPRLELAVDREKATRLGTSVDAVARTLRIALAGAEVGRLRDENARETVPLVLRLDRAQRSSVDDLLALDVPSADGRALPLRELVTASNVPREQFVYHKDLRPVTYVIGEVAGGEESPVYAILGMKGKLAKLRDPLGQPLQVLSTHPPADPTAYAMKWDGEWQITYEVFRDMGLAFAVVLVLIYVLVVGWFRSFFTPLVIMAPIPLTLIGILPAHAVGGVYFTATSMIGFIALAGIIVRNSILLVDFVNLEIESGRPLMDAVLSAGAVRFRPIALTAAALVVGGSVILLDPIFQGLAVALISGVVVASALTLVVIPLLYFTLLQATARRGATEETGG